MDVGYWFNGSWRRVYCTCNSRLHDVAQFRASGLGIVLVEWLCMERRRGEAVNDEGLPTRAPIGIGIGIGALPQGTQPRFVQSHHPLIVEQSYPFKFN